MDKSYTEKILDFLKTKKTWLIALGVTLVLVVPPAAYFLSPINSEGKSAQFVVEKGYGTKDIAAALYDAGLIKSQKVFLVYSVLTGRAHKLKPGSYELSPAMSLPAITRALVAGPAEDVAILVKEGESLAEIESNLVADGVLPKGALTKRRGKSLEGFFFPDTYRFFKNSTTEDVIGRFMKNFYQKAMPVLANGKVQIANGKTMNVYEMLTIASIIEKEVPFTEDRPVVAGILYRRLAIGMALQVDSAPETYDRPGLPKTPISNPGADAIAAAAHPVRSDYLYYLSDPRTKRTVFARTFDEHVQNKFKYLR